ncbi:tetratricopeptide repeat protein [Lacrimispora sp. BS-2]|uniref:Tetratricopeptide repeat protein n=1 Tax=Lacrimispora sp. BS-2 TaxID=3151850 RepID=A0AAU7PJD3_9FIRM
MKRTLALLITIAVLVTVCAACSKSLEKMSASELLDLGEKYLLEMNYEKAVVCFDQLIKVEPRNPRGYTGLAETYIAKGDTDKAIAVLQDGLGQLPDDHEYLKAAADIYGDMIDIDPRNADVYLGLADVYSALDDKDKAIDILRQGLDELPENEKIAERYYKLLIPEYEIKQTYYTELRADDGVLIWRDESNQPVFLGTGERITSMNAVFKDELPAESTMSDSEWLFESYYSREGYTYEEANNGRVGGSEITWKESYRKNQYLSFVGSSEWDGLGPHGGFDYLGHTFDCGTGKAMKISDLLLIDENQVQETLYNEYIAYQSSRGDDGKFLAEAAQGYDSGSYINYYVESVKEQCNPANAVFWLAEDGVHIYFNQYTFYYAAGASELIIPYTRFDLLRAPFAESQNNRQESYSEPAASMPAAQNIIESFTDDEYKKLSIFLSNFSELEFDNFDAADYADEQLIEFAIWHTYLNNYNAIINVTDSEHYYLKISAGTIFDVVDKYFGISVMHKSVGYIDNPDYWNYGQYQYLFKDGYYYFTGADGEPLKWSEIVEFYDNGDGTFNAVTHEWASHNIPAQYERRKFWEQLIHPDDVLEGAVAGGSHTAVIAPYAYGGKDTYKLLRWTAK